MDNPEKLATYDTQDEDNKNKYTAPYGLETTHNTISAAQHYT